MEHSQQFDANGIIVHPYKLLIIVHDCYTLRKLYIAILALLYFLKFRWELYIHCTTPETNPQVIWSICNSLMQMASLYNLTNY